MLLLCLNFKTKSTEANFASLCYFRVITKKKTKNKKLKLGELFGKCFTFNKCSVITNTSHKHIKECFTL